MSRSSIFEDDCECSKSLIPTIDEQIKEFSNESENSVNTNIKENENIRKSVPEKLSETKVIAEKNVIEREVNVLEREVNVVERENIIDNLSKYRMARSCGPDYNVNKVTSWNKFECRYLGVGEDENGRKIRNPFKTWKGTLPSCNDDIVISDELERDVRELAYHAAGGDEAKLNINEFMCSIQSIPMN
tara:strand:- start:845 stop:1408 length:564 start_codon:yes stop_codon:yes gene_type:complete